MPSGHTRTRPVAFLMVTMLAIILGALVVSRAADTEQELKYEALAEFDYGAPMVGGVALRNCPTGVTTATLDAGEKAITRIIVSIAVTKQNTLSTRLRISARTKDGRSVPGQDIGRAAAAGTEHGVVTVISEFPVRSKQIKRLVLERSVAER